MSVLRGAGRPFLPAFLAAALVLLAASFATSRAGPTSAPVTRGPGGPILEIAGSSNPFSSYYGEVLRAEGLNEFAVKDIVNVDAATLAAHDVAIVGDIDLTPAQVRMLGAWVRRGGDLIAMRPDAQLARLLGLSSTRSSISDAYLKVDTGRRPAPASPGRRCSSRCRRSLHARWGHERR